MAVFTILDPGFMGQIGGLLHPNHKIDLIESGLGMKGHLSGKSHATKIRIRGPVADDFDDVDVSLQCREVEGEFRVYFDIAPERDWPAHRYDGNHPLMDAWNRDFQGRAE